jgi:26S proteasome regulatory subunit N11
MLELAKTYNKAVQEEEKTTKEKLIIQNVGKLDPKRHLEEDVKQLMTSNITQLLGTLTNTIIF